MLVQIHLHIFQYYSFNIPYQISNFPLQIFLLLPRGWFLDLNVTDILGQIILCCGRFFPCILQSVQHYQNPWLLLVSWQYTFPSVVTTKDVSKCSKILLNVLCGAKLPLLENCCPQVYPLKFSLESFILFIWRVRVINYLRFYLFENVFMFPPHL